MKVSDPEEAIKVYNLSSVEISEREIDLLSLGTKFVPPTGVSLQEEKIDLLKFSRKLLLNHTFHDKTYSDPSLIKPASCFIPKTVDSQVLKGIVEDLEIFANELSDTPKLQVKDNLTAEQRLALQKFKRHNNLVYFKADKGSAVLLNPSFYKEKVLSILNNGKYTPLVGNVDHVTKRALNKLIKKYSTCLTDKERSAISTFDYKTTNLYGLPKIHKSKVIASATQKTLYLHLPNPQDLVLRLIFGGPESVISGLSDLLNILLQPFVDKVNSRVEDTFDFLLKIPSFELSDLPYIELISVDIISMYENLEQNLGLPALRYYLTRYNNLLPSRFSIDFVIEAMKFVLREQYRLF